MLFALESNRLFYIEKSTWVQVQQLAIPVEGLIVWLKNFGFVTVFRTQLKEQVRHYINSLSNVEQTAAFDHKTFTKQHDPAIGK